MFSYGEDLNASNECSTAKLLKQGYRYYNPGKAFSKFYRRHHELVSKFNVGFKCIFYIKAYPEPEFYGDIVYKFKTIMGRTDFWISFEKQYYVTSVLAMI